MFSNSGSSIFNQPAASSTSNIFGSTPNKPANATPGAGLFGGANNASLTATPMLAGAAGGGSNNPATPNLNTTANPLASSTSSLLNPNPSASTALVPSTSALATTTPSTGAAATPGGAKDDGKAAKLDGLLGFPSAWRLINDNRTPDLKYAYHSKGKGNDVEACLREGKIPDDFKAALAEQDQWIQENDALLTACTIPASKVNQLVSKTNEMERSMKILSNNIEHQYQQADILLNLTKNCERKTRQAILDARNDSNRLSSLNLVPSNDFWELLRGMETKVSQYKLQISQLNRILVEALNGQDVMMGDSQSSRLTQKEKVFLIMKQQHIAFKELSQLIAEYHEKTEMLREEFKRIQKGDNQVIFNDVERERKRREHERKLQQMIYERSTDKAREKLIQNNPQQQQQGMSILGTPATSQLGMNPSTSLISNTGSGLFSGNTNTGSVGGGGLFGNTGGAAPAAGGSLFGGGGAAPGGGGSLFGGSAVGNQPALGGGGGGLFGNTGGAAPAGGSLFGGGAAAPATGGGLFTSASSLAGGGAGGGMFGGGNTNLGGGFGAGGNQPGVSFAPNTGAPGLAPPQLRRSQTAGGRRR